MSAEAIRIRKRIDSETLHLPELKGLVGRDVEIIVVAEPPAGAGVRSIEELRSKLPGDPFGSDFDETLRQWRAQPWRAGGGELPEGGPG